MNDIGLAGTETAKGANVGRRLGQNNVTGIDKELGHQVECLLRTRRNDDVVRVSADDAVIGHDVDELLAQGLPALTGTVLQCLGARRKNQLLRGLGEALQRKILQVRHTARK